MDRRSFFRRAAGLAVVPAAAVAVAALPKIAHGDGWEYVRDLPRHVRAPFVTTATALDEGYYVAMSHDGTDFNMNFSHVPSPFMGMDGQVLVSNGGGFSQRWDDLNKNSFYNELGDEYLRISPDGITRWEYRVLDCKLYRRRLEADWK